MPRALHSRLESAIVLARQWLAHRLCCDNSERSKAMRCALCARHTSSRSHSISHLAAPERCFRSLSLIANSDFSALPRESSTTRLSTIYDLLLSIDIAKLLQQHVSANTLRKYPITGCLLLDCVDVVPARRRAPQGNFVGSAGQPAVFRSRYRDCPNHKGRDQAGLA